VPFLARRFHDAFDVGITADRFSPPHQPTYTGFPTIIGWGYRAMTTMPFPTSAYHAWAGGVFGPVVPLGWKDAWLRVAGSRTPVPDQVAFRCDFPAWLDRLPRRNRRIAEALSLGHTTGDVAKRFRVSPGRISQLRREMHKSWYEFHGESVAATPTPHRAV
jgi:hypothetical protein